jgi:hypothetical protein
MSDTFPIGYFWVARSVKNMPIKEAQKSNCSRWLRPSGELRHDQRSPLLPRRLRYLHGTRTTSKAKRIGAKGQKVDESPKATIRKESNGYAANVMLEVCLVNAMNVALVRMRPFGLMSSFGIYPGEYTFSGLLQHAKNAVIAWGRCPV